MFEKLKAIVTKKFPRIIKGVYIYSEYNDRKSKYCTELWKKQDWDVGGVIPMLKDGEFIAYYTITKAYYTMGGSHSDWAMGDDGKDRDFKFSHLLKN